jgi:hypothetical protein
VYIARYEISSSESNADLSVQSRCRINQKGSWQAWERIINSNLGQGPSSAGGVDYDVFFAPNVTGTAGDDLVVISYDILSFDGSDNTNSSLFLESLTLKEATITPD